MKFKNKFLLLIILTFSFVLFFNINNVKAVSYNSDHYIEWTNSSGTTWRICANEDFYIMPGSADKNGNYWLNSYSLSTNERINISLYENGVDYWERELSGSFLRSFYTSDTLPDFRYKGKVIYYGVNKDTGEKSVFFQQTPRLVPVAILNRGAMKETTLQIRQIIPLIIVVVVSFLGLRKALQMLSTILRRS